MKVELEGADLVRAVIAAIGADASLKRDLLAALGGSNTATAHLAPKAFAAKHSLGLSTVRAMIRDGRLPSIKSGRRVLVPADASIGTPTSTKRSPRVESDRDFALRIVGGRP